MAAVTGPTYTGLPQDEIDRRYRLVREAAARDGLDAVIVCGNEYTGFEGAVTYLSGFVIVHRYAYVLLPVDGDPSIVFPSEARYVGEHGTTWIDEQVFVDRPGDWIADRVRGKRVGVYGMDYVMTVRDYSALAPVCILVGWDVAFDHARMVKSELELESVRESVRINTEGFWVFLDAFEPGKSEREILAPCEEYFVSQGCGRWTMDMVLDGPNGSALPEFKIAGTRPIGAGDCVLPSLEVAGAGGHWVEVSRAICPGEPSDDDEADDGGVRRVLRRGAGGAPRRRDRARRAPCGGEGLPRPRLHARSRHRPLDRDDDDRVPEDRRGGRDGAGGRHGAVDAPARDLRGRAGVPLHAGHVARDRGRRRAARGAADEDLRRHREAVLTKSADAATRSACLSAYFVVIPDKVVLFWTCMTRAEMVVFRLGCGYFIQSGIDLCGGGDMMRKRLGIAAVAAVAALTFAGGRSLTPLGPQNVRAVFFANWDRYARGYLVNQIPADRLNDIDYAFATVTPDGRCALTDPWSDYQAPTWSGTDSVNGVADDPSNLDQHLFGNFNQLLELKALHPDLRVEMSIGGWTGSTYFSDAAATPASRKAFVASCIDLIIDGNLPTGGWPTQAGGPGAAAGLFDGINIDWEYPGVDPGNGAHHSPPTSPTRPPCCRSSGRSSTRPARSPGSTTR